MNFAKHVVLTLSVLFFPFALSAQTCCSGGVPLGGSFGLGTADNNALQFLLTYDYNALHTLFDRTEVLDDPTRKRNTQSTILEINYGLSNRFTITGLFPYIRQERKIETYDGSTEVTSAQGLGDILFLLKYRMLDPVKNPDWEWVVGGGFKLPSGKTDHKNAQGLTLAADMQPGSGSFDLLYWMFFQKSKFLIPKLSLLSVTTYRYNGTNKEYNQTQEYKFGNEFQASLGLNYNFFAKWPVDVFSFIRYRNQEVDLIDDTTFPGSGGDWIYLIPGTKINFSDKISLRLSGDIPVYRKLKGLQLTTSYKLTAALQFQINPGKLFLTNK